MVATLSRLIGGNAFVLLTLTALFWAGNAVAGRSAVGELSPMLLTSLRWLGVVIFLWGFMRHRFAADLPVIRQRLPFVLTMGAVGYTLFNALFYVAAHTTTAVNIGIIQGAIPVFVLAIAFIADKAPINPLQMAGILVTMLGVAFIATKGDLLALMQLAFTKGDILMVIACFFYAGYTVGLKRRPAVSGLGFFAVMATAAFLTSLPLVAVEIALGQFQWPTPKGWLITLYIAVFPSFLSQLFFMRGVDLIGPGRAGIFVNLVPVFAALLAVLILGEAFQSFHALALALVLGGIVLAERGKQRT
jgi:drug/metabolite transporter (DMT)-like permease